jgi:hypothetical protein
MRWNSCGWYACPDPTQLLEYLMSAERYTRSEGVNLWRIAPPFVGWVWPAAYANWSDPVEPAPVCSAVEIAGVVLSYQPRVPTLALSKASRKNTPTGSGVGVGVGAGVGVGIELRAVSVTKRPPITVALPAPTRQMRSVRPGETHFTMPA